MAFCASPLHVQMCIESAILEAGEREAGVPVFSSPWGREFVLLFQGRPANSTSTVHRQQFCNKIDFPLKNSVLFSSCHNKNRLCSKGLWRGLAGF